MSDLTERLRNADTEELHGHASSELSELLDEAADAIDSLRSQVEALTWERDTERAMHVSNVAYLETKCREYGSRAEAMQRDAERYRHCRRKACNGDETKFSECDASVDEGIAKRTAIDTAPNTADTDIGSGDA